jgi:transglutaminase-like putative cysteine protease
MVKIERLLQVNIAALTVVGTLLLGLGQNNPMLPALSLFAAVTSIYFTDILGWFRLHRVIANLAALGALFVSMREFDIFGGNSASQLRAIANLLVYLQFVLLYQEKNQRVYWQLGVLSLLQVVVAAALDLKIGLGLLLLVYMFTALSAMALLFVYSQIEQVQNQRAEDGQPGDASPAAWAPIDPPRAARKCSDAQIQSSMLGWRFLGRLAGIGVATWILALTVFLATPRLGNAVWRGAPGGSSTGFSRDIRLGEMRRILQNNAPAMTVKLLDRFGQPVVLEHPPYLRGTALSVYRSTDRGGSWSQPHFSNSWRVVALAPPPTGDWVETRFSLEAGNSEVLFSMAPCYRTGVTPESVRYDVLDEQLVHAKANPLRAHTEAIQYSVATTGIRNGQQNEFWPSRQPVDTLKHRIFDKEWKPLRDFEPLRFQATARLADQILDEAGLTRRRPYEAAKALEAYFKRPGLFSYTLDAAGVPPRPWDVDPIEHFLLVHRRGHCEFFASSLVMLLRSQGIPARVVVGYHGGDFNSIGKYYLVRQRDAHAWVEVYLEREQTPQPARDSLPPDAAGAWLRLDPTPEGEETSGPPAMAPLTDTADFLESVWNDYVLGLNSDRQKQAIYRPVIQRVQTFADNVQLTAQGLAGKLDWDDLVRRYVAWFGVERPESTFPWKTSLILVSLGATWLVLVRIAWRNWHARGYGRQLALWLVNLGWSGRKRRGSMPAARAARVDFFRRFEKLLARRRFRRRLTQTQREFVFEVGRRAGAGALLDRVVEAYYRVRFGGRPLDSEELAAIEKTLEELGQTLARRHA